MGTRAVITCIANTSYEKNFSIYRHSDGYPSAIIPELTDVLTYAWELPRYESADFCAAIIAAWKDAGGGYIYLADNEENHGIDYFYEIFMENEILMVKVMDRKKSILRVLPISADMSWEEKIS